MNFENYYTRDELIAVCGSYATMRRRINEMEDSGRYPPEDLIHDSNILLVRHEAFADWINVKKRRKKKLIIPPYKRRAK